MRVVFLGTPEWAVPSLERIAGSRHEILAVVTNPPRRSSRRGSPEQPPVGRRAAQLGLSLVHSENARSEEFLSWFRSQGADAGVIVAYGEILPIALLESAPNGFVNLHFSLLPRYRGAAPVQAAIAAGERVTGVTTMAVSRRLDAGDIYLQREEPIGPAESSQELGLRLSQIGAELLLETLDRIESRSLDRTAQDEALATYARTLTKENGRVKWDSDAPAIARCARAHHPWPGCFTTARGRLLNLFDLEPEAPATGGAIAAGTVLGLDRGSLRIACGSESSGRSVLRVGRLQFEGRRPVRAEEAVNGRSIAPGDRLGDGERPDENLAGGRRTDRDGA